MTNDLKIVDCGPEHYEGVTAIYNYYIENTTISFEEESLTAKDIGARVEAYTSQYPWLVGIVGSTIIGYAYATGWQSRCAYRSTVEASIYLDHTQIGSGYGRHLYGALLDKLKHGDCHAIIAGIALPNKASVKLQEYFGFKKVAHFEEVGFKQNKWIDVGYWQLTNPTQCST